ASAAVGLPDGPRQHSSCVLVLAILDGVESSARTFAENEHIFTHRGVSGPQCTDRAEGAFVPYHRIVQPEAALHRIQRLPETGSRLAAIDRGVAHYPHDHTALLGDAEQFADDCLPFLRRPIVQGAVV